MAKTGIIGGTGLEKTEMIPGTSEIHPDTPWGRPSSPLTTGRIGKHEVVMLRRHGPEHTIPPTQVNNRANIRALRDSGCDRIIAVSACGSLREEIRRGDLVVADQFIDFTRRRPLTFFDSFEPGNLMHTSLADPFDVGLRRDLVAAGRALGLRLHERSTVITIEGPRLSTRAESRMFRAWGADVINMSTAPEATLAAEAGLPYALVAMSTDYDCWKTDEPPDTVDEILRVFNSNVENVTRLLLEFFTGGARTGRFQPK